MDKWKEKEKVNCEDGCRELHDGSTHTLEEVAEAFGTSRERIQQMERKALRKIHPKTRRRQKLKAVSYTHLTLPTMAVV